MEIRLFDTPDAAREGCDIFFVVYSQKIHLSGFVNDFGNEERPIFISPSSDMWI
jgi:hypothetical protein